MRVQVIELENRCQLEVKRLSYDPEIADQFVADIYRGGQLIWYVGIFGSVAEAVDAVEEMDKTRILYYVAENRAASNHPTERRSE